MALSKAQELLVRETRVAYGVVPHALGDEAIGEFSWRLVGDEFLLRGTGEQYFHYRKGKGITVERDEKIDCSDEALWLSGSVYSAVASINGLLPIHASAVCHGGRVFAFTGPSGAGKSTLVTALASDEMPLFCDDTLILDLSEEGRITCLPGHKRLKLSEEAIGLTGASPQEPVGPEREKFYAEPGAVYHGSPLPLADLIFLEQGPEPVFREIAGAERLLRLQDDHYTAFHFAAARDFDRKDHFAHLARLAPQIAMSCFARPFDISRFKDGVDAARAFICEVTLKRAGHI